MILEKQIHKEIAEVIQIKVLDGFVMVVIAFDNKDLGIAVTGLDKSVNCRKLIKPNAQLKISGLLKNPTKLSENHLEETIKWRLMNATYLPTENEKVIEEVGKVISTRENGDLIEAQLVCENIGTIIIDDKKTMMTKKVLEEGNILVLTGHLFKNDENKRDYISSHYRWI